MPQGGNDQVWRESGLERRCARFAGEGGRAGPSGSGFQRRPEVRLPHWVAGPFTAGAGCKACTGKGRAQRRARAFAVSMATMPGIRRGKLYRLDAIGCADDKIKLLAVRRKPAGVHACHRRGRQPRLQHDHQRQHKPQRCQSRYVTCPRHLPANMPLMQICRNAASGPCRKPVHRISSIYDE